MWSRALQALASNPIWLAEDGWVIAQIHPNEYQELGLFNLSEFEKRKYGSTQLVFYKNKVG